jgi:hypothetical protein
VELRAADSESWTFEKEATELRAALDWLRSINVELSGSRLLDYLAHLEGMAAAGSPEAELDYNRRHSPRAIANSILEGLVVIEVHRAFRGGPRTNELHSKLAKFARGPIEYTSEEGGETSARDLGFELDVGASLKKAGLEVAFEASGDLAFGFQTARFFVECKRPQTPKKVWKHLQIAQDQLAKRYRTAKPSERVRGLIAVSASKVINPGFDQLTAATNEQLLTLLETNARNFVMAHCQRWRHPNDERTLGALIDYRCMAYVHAIKGVRPSQVFSIDFKVNPSPGDEALLLALGRRLSPGGLTPGVRRLNPWGQPVFVPQV